MALFLFPFLHNYMDLTSTFFESVKNWLGELEKVLENNWLKACSDIAIYRGTLISVERGLVPADLIFTKRKSHKKVMDAVAIETLKKANELINTIISGPLAQINEAERLIRQIIPIAELKGFLPPYESNANRTIYLNQVWTQMSNDPDLANICLHIKGLVTQQDILILLDRNL